MMSSSRWRRQAVAGESVFVMEAVFASVVGKELFQDTHLSTVPEPNHEMPLVFRFRLLEIVLAISMEKCGVCAGIS